MKLMRTFLPLVLTLALTACAGASSTNAPLPTVVLDSSGPAAGIQPAGAGLVTASAEAVPQVKVSLSFPLMGWIQSVEVQAGDTVNAGDVLARLETTLLEARVAEAQAGVDSAATRVRYLRRVGPGDEQLNAAIADVDRANAVLEQMQATLAQATLTSPISGTVVEVDAAPGETATPGRIVAVIADLKTMRFETTDLSERDIASVQVGQSATVYIEALNGEFPGRVAEIARSSETVGGDVVYRVSIALDDPPDGLRWGMSADVTIRTEQ